MARTYPDTIAAPVQREFSVRKSRFIAHVAPVSSVVQAEETIAHVRKQYWDARHHCTAMITGILADQARSSDDGEPSGTAGIPLLEVLRRRQLTDVVVIVARYFGGIKLGAGGLVRAYSTATSEALQEARLVHRVALTRLTLEVSHADAGRFDNLLRDGVQRHGATLGDTEYGAVVTFEVWAPAEAVPRFTDEIASASGGAIVPISGEERIVDVASR